MNVRRSIFGYLDDGDQYTLRPSRSLAKHEEWTEAILPADAAVARPEGETNRRPLVALAIFMMAALGILVFRLFSLQIISGEDNLALANGNRIREKVARAPRGMIYDRHGIVLARNQASFDVTVIPQLLPEEVGDRRKLYEQVGQLLGMKPEEVRDKAEVTCWKREPNCLAVPTAQLIQAGVERDRALLFYQKGPELTGFALEDNPIREYVDENQLSVFLGYTGRVSVEEVKVNTKYRPTDLIGKMGLEKQYEDILRGTDGGERTEVDATGRPIRVLASRDPVAGKDIVLSIDQGLQRKLAESIRKQMDAAKVPRASGVALNPKTGEILAAVSLPTYDNNAFSRGISQSQYQSLLTDPGQPLFNKVASGTYPAGSIIKPLGASAALQENIVTPHTIINDTGQLDVVNPYDPSIHYIYKGWEHSGLGLMNVYTAMAQSSDIYFYTMAGGFTNFTKYLGIQKLADYYKKFGLGARTGVDLPEESLGRVPTPEWKKKFSGEDWYTGDTYNVSVGQGDILVTPLQMAIATAAVANGGTLYEPHFMSRVQDSKGKVVSQVAPKVVRKDFISPKNLEVVREGMRQTVNSPKGTACCIIEREVPVPVAGKTGSAETDTNNAAVSKPHSWFVSFAPYNNPEIVTVVLVEKSGEGAEFAVPATRETLAWYFTEGAGAKK